MRNTENALRILRCELAFAEQGGYRSPLGWRWPLVFEDSPTCRKEASRKCKPADCLLMDFVPKGRHSEVAPCRHIPLNERGDTLDSLYRTGTNEEIEQSLTIWLRKTISQLEAPPSTTMCDKEAA